MAKLLSHFTRARKKRLLVDALEEAYSRCKSPFKACTSEVKFQVIKEATGVFWEYVVNSGLGK